MKHFISSLLSLFIAMALNAQGYVTPQMFGAKADGKTDDKRAIQMALDNSNAVFFPAGTYITSESLIVHSNTTVWGTGRESRIVNRVHTGFGKSVLLCGNLSSGDTESSPNKLTKYKGTISDDRWSMTMSNISILTPGDLLLLTSGAIGTHNPRNAYVSKVKSIDKKKKKVELVDFVSHPDLAGEVTVQVLKNIPKDSRYETYMSENICVHDMSFEQSVDEGSGMYVILLATYKSSFYNLWLRGNTCIGSNMTAKTTFCNIDCSFDGGAVDAPEYFIESKISNLHGSRFGNRMNQIGLSILHGYAGIIENCDIDFAGNGKVGMLEQVRPVITGNRFRNLSSKGGGLQGSLYGGCFISHNILTSVVSYPIVSLFGKQNVFTNNWIETAVSRWLFDAYNFDYASNDLSNNHIIGLSANDALYHTMPTAEISTLDTRAVVATKTVHPGKTLDLLEVVDVISSKAKMVTTKIYFNNIVDAVVGQEGVPSFTFRSATLEIIYTQGYFLYSTSDKNFRVLSKGTNPIKIKNNGNKDLVYTLTTIVKQ